MAWGWWHLSLGIPVPRNGCLLIPTPLIYNLCIGFSAEPNPLSPLMKKLLLLSAFALLCLNQTFAQTFIIQDPSFEGTQGNFAPPDWNPCIGASTQPYQYSFPAYAGHSYLGLSYGNNGGDTSQTDAVSQKLTVPFAGNGAPYTVTVALCNLTSQTGAVCQICAGYDSCSPVVALWTSPVIQDTVINSLSAPKWSVYTFTCNPSDAYTYLIIRVTAANYTGSTGDGYTIGVDSLGISAVTTGIQTINSTTVSLYPNPATNMVTVTTDGTEPLVFNLYDLTGREIITRECTGTANNIDVRQLAKGIYVAKVLQAGKTYCQNLIIQ